MQDIEEKEAEKLTKKLLEKYKDIIFIDEKSATKTNLVQCEIWMKNQKPQRYEP